MENINIKTMNDINNVYKNTYLYQSEPIQKGEKNLFTKTNATPSRDLDLDNGNTDKAQGSYAVTDFIDIGNDNINKSLIFRLHIKSIFFNSKKEKIKSINTPEYPENVEIKIPENAKYIRTVYCLHDEKILYIVKRDKINPYFNNNQETPLLPDIELSNEYKDKTILYVDELGFDNTGKKDNSQALLNLEAIIERNSKWNNDKIFTIVFGSGTYKFTHPHMNFLSRKHKNAVFGLNIQGQGVTTNIQYLSDDTHGINGEEHFFIKNDNKFANITFQNFKFEGGEYKKASFCRLTATPYPQHIVLDKIMFNHVYTTMEIKGCDCGSEIMFDHCKWNGINDNVLKAVRPGISSQFLNYWFINPDFQCQGGSLVNLELGGNVNIIGGNLIHKNTGGGFVKGGTFFKLGYDWYAEDNKKLQSLGICRFLCEGTRFECSVDRNSRILESYWDNNGSIVFINCDDGAKNGAGIKENITVNKVDENGNLLNKGDGNILRKHDKHYDVIDKDGNVISHDGKPAKKILPTISDEYITEYQSLKNPIDNDLLKEFKFIILNGAPSVKFENCIFHGKHVYDVSNNIEVYSNNHQNTIVYDGCIIGGQYTMDKPWDFIDMIERTNKDEKYYASHLFPTIKFINLPRQFEIYEGCHFKDRIMPKEIVQKKYISLKNIYGSLPVCKSEDTIIDEGRIITGLILYAPKDFSTGKSKNWTNHIRVAITEDTKDQETNKTVRNEILTLFEITNTCQLSIYGEETKKIPSTENLEKDGFSYNISFKKPIIVGKNNAIRLYRGNTAESGESAKDKIVAMLEFI